MEYKQKHHYSPESASASSETQAGQQAIETKSLTVAYNKRPVLWDINISIPQNSISAIIGPNGAGKSTLLKAMLELIPRISGEIRFIGQTLSQIRTRLSYVPQRESVDWNYPIRVKELVEMGLYHKRRIFSHKTRTQKKIQEQRVWDALEQVQLQDFARRLISELSGGQQQRAFLARSLVMDPTILIMDEPFSGVDSATEKSIYEVMHMLRKQKKTIVIVHHNLNTLEDFADYVVMLNLSLIAQGPIGTTLNDDTLNKTYRGKLTLLQKAFGAVIEKGKLG